MSGVAHHPAAGDASRRLEAMALRVMASIAPLEVGRSRSAGEAEALITLRSREAQARGWLPGTPHLEDADRDAYDDQAVHIVLRKGGEVIGGFRLLLPQQDRALPIETAFDLVLQPPGQVVQWGRLILAPAYRGDRTHRLPLACFAAIWLETTRRGFALIAGVVSPRLRQMYEGMGWDFHILGPSRTVDGEERFPAMTTTQTVDSGLQVLGSLLTPPAT